MKGPYQLSPQELRALQMVLLEMLVELDRICKKYGIRYCLIAGTLLGAVRHKGFIPWDDDLDVAMTRDEYRRFQAACAQELDHSRFFFQDQTTDAHYRWGWGRLRRNDSEFVRIGQEHLRMRTGIFLDVFPLDNVPDPWILRCVHNFHCFTLRKVLYAEVGKIRSAYRIGRLVYRLMARIPARFVFARLERLAMRYNRKKTRYVRILTFPTPKNRRFGYCAQWYRDLANIEFEGLTFPGIREWDDYLRFKFGAYEALPPKNERHTHPVSSFKLPTSCGMYERGNEQWWIGCTTAHSLWKTCEGSTSVCKTRNPGSFSGTGRRLR